jgi:hypothetical protein
VVVDGGLGVAKAVSVGTNLTVTGNASVTGATTLTGAVSVTDATSSSSVTTGAVVVTGGVGIGGSAHLSQLVAHSTVAAIAGVTGAINCAGGVNVDKNLEVAESIRVNQAGTGWIQAPVIIRTTAPTNPNDVVRLTDLSGYATTFYERKSNIKLLNLWDVGFEYQVSLDVFRNGKLCSLQIIRDDTPSGNIDYESTATLDYTLPTSLRPANAYTVSLHQALKHENVAIDIVTTIGTDGSVTIARAGASPAFTVASVISLPYAITVHWASA